MNEENINLLFMPVSAINGMANSKRLFNYCKNLSSGSIFSINNLVHEPNLQSKRAIIIDGKTEGISYYRIIYNYKNIVGLCMFIWLTCKVIRNTYNKKRHNILYHSGYPNIRNIFFIIYAKFLRYKIVFDVVEDNSTITTFKSPIQKFKNKTSLVLYKYIYVLADGIVCISKSILNKTEKITRGRIPIILIPISIYEPYFLKLSEKSNSISSTKLFYGGSFGEKDGIKYLLSAFDVLAEDHNVTLILSGVGNKRDMSFFNGILEGLKNKSKVQYLGYLEDSEYYEKLLNVDIQCVLRTNSNYANAGFPFKLGEMLATGKPVIVTKVSDVENYLKPEDAFLIEPENVDDIVSAVRFIINNPSIAYSVGLNGKNIALKYFGSAKITKDFIDFIRKEVL